MNTINVYSPAELKESFPDAFEKAHRKWAYNQNEIPWADETMDSLQGLFKATSGVHLKNWSIGAYSYSYIELEWDNEDVKDFTGARAMAWMENNLLGDLRIKANSKNYYKYNNSYRSIDAEHIKRFGKICRPYMIGKIKPAPFTGYYADDEYLDAVLDCIKSGMTLEDSFLSLADTARKLFESDLEGAQSEEEFLIQDHLQYTDEGRLI